MIVIYNITWSVEHKPHKNDNKIWLFNKLTCPCCGSYICESKVAIDIHDYRFYSERYRICISCFYILKLLVPQFINKYNPEYLAGHFECDKTLVDFVNKFMGKKDE